MVRDAILERCGRRSEVIKQSTEPVPAGILSAFWLARTLSNGFEKSLGDWDVHKIIKTYSPSKGIVNFIILRTSYRVPTLKFPDPHRFQPLRFLSQFMGKYPIYCVLFPLTHK